MMTKRMALGIIGAAASSVFSGCATKEVNNDPVAVEREAIHATIAARQSQLMDCYQAVIEKRPGAEGKVVMDWEIFGEGETREIKPHSVDPKIELIVPCLTEQIRTMRFAPPKDKQDGVGVRYPFYFSENGKLSESGK